MPVPKSGLATAQIAGEGRSAMKLLSWNVNGLRAVLGKGFGEFMTAEMPDIMCLQETKARPEQVPLPLELGGYHGYWNSATKPGYSGVAVFTREKPLEVTSGMGIDEHDTEGRVLTLEYPDFMLVNVYTPNAQDGLRRLPYRLAWDEAFRLHLCKLALRKPVVFAVISTSPIRKSTSPDRAKTASARGFPTRSAPASQPCWTAGLSIPSAISTRM